VLTIAALTLSAACLSSQFAAKTLRGGATAADREFDRVARAFLDDFLRANPVFGTANGYHGHDHLLGDFSASALASTVHAYRKHKADIAAIDPSELNPGAALDREVVKNAIDLAIFDLTELKRPERDPLFYQEILGFGGLHLLEGSDGPERLARLEALAGRMERIPEFLETARKNLQNPPAIFAAAALENIPATRESYQGIELRALRVAVPPDLRERLSTAQSKALRALSQWHHWLAHDVFAHPGSDWRLGAERFKKRLSIMLGSDARPEELVAAARKDVSARRAAMHAIAAPAHEKIFPHHRHSETGGALTNVIVAEVLREGSGRQTAARSRVDGMKQQLGVLREFIVAHRIVKLPPSPDGLAVSPAPGFVKDLSIASFTAASDSGVPTLWIAADAAGPGRPPREYSDCELQVIAIHEAYPGHYVQWWNAEVAVNRSLWRRIFPNVAFSEGWAAFAEDTMLDSGFGAGDPVCQLVAHKAGLESALNLILDERFHRGNDDDAALDAWATDLLTREGFHDQTEARAKIRRAKLTSAQLSTYFAGRAVFVDAFRKWMAGGGAGRDAAGFADRVLSFGAIPPAAIERLLFDSKTSGK